MPKFPANLTCEQFFALLIKQIFVCSSSYHCPRSACSLDLIASRVAESNVGHRSSASLFRFFCLKTTKILCRQNKCPNFRPTFLCKQFFALLSLNNPFIVTPPRSCVDLIAIRVAVAVAEHPPATFCTFRGHFFCFAKQFSVKKNTWRGFFIKIGGNN